ncbi:MAG: DNA adenine methylase [Candidatus Nanopelagicales bacterium]|nr:DNA adenine methylase [Candidatus Nanopelagicales bacterium]MDZ4250633.1 DNA adenine methylase [Candidatus Nanopelagicales bacterium]
MAGGGDRTRATGWSYDEPLFDCEQLPLPPTRVGLKPVNVAQVPLISPFRYPGGKTWLVPWVRTWARKHRLSTFVEPFAGGASCGLMVASETLARTVHLNELDPVVASVWELLVNGSDADTNALCQLILEFEVTLDNVKREHERKPDTLVSRAFQTIVRNRTARGGILASGAGISKAGEAGRGLRSRWYPETLVRRMRIIRTIRQRLVFTQLDALDLMVDRNLDQSECGWFIDPPYTVGGKRAGSRLYTQHEVDHKQVFSLAAELRGPVMMTYDESREVRELADEFEFLVERVPMKSTHHALHRELVLSRG